MTGTYSRDRVRKFVFVFFFFFFFFFFFLNKNKGIHGTSKRDKAEPDMKHITAKQKQKQKHINSQMTPSTTGERIK